MIGGVVNLLIRLIFQLFRKSTEEQVISSGRLFPPDKRHSYDDLLATLSCNTREIAYRLGWLWLHLAP